MAAASEAYAAAVQLQPTDVDAYRNYGMTVRATGDAAAALRAYDAALTLRPNDGLTHFSRGNMLRGAQERIGAFRLAVRHLPDHHGARSNLLSMLRSEQRTEEATAVLRDWARVDPEVGGRQLADSLVRPNPNPNPNPNLNQVGRRQLADSLLGDGRKLEAAWHYQAAARHRSAPSRVAAEWTRHTYYGYTYYGYTYYGR